MHTLGNLLLIGCFVLFCFKKCCQVILMLVPFNITNILICHLCHLNVLLSLGYLIEMNEGMFIAVLLMYLLKTDTEFKNNCYTVSNLKQGSYLTHYCAVNFTLTR